MELVTLQPSRPPPARTQRGGRPRPTHTLLGSGGPSGGTADGHTRAHQQADGSTTRTASTRRRGCGSALKRKSPGTGRAQVNREDRGLRWAGTWTPPPPPQAPCHTPGQHRPGRPHQALRRHLQAHPRAPRAGTGESRVSPRAKGDSAPPGREHRKPPPSTPSFWRLLGNPGGSTVRS